MQPISTLSLSLKVPATFSLLRLLQTWIILDPLKLYQATLLYRSMAPGTSALSVPLVEIQCHPACKAPQVSPPFLTPAVFWEGDCRWPPPPKKGQTVSVFENARSTCMWLQHLYPHNNSMSLHESGRECLCSKAPFPLLLFFSGWVGFYPPL